MHLAYIDETYTEAIYSFGVLLVQEERDAAMQRQVLSIPQRFAEHGLDPEAELRGSDLFHSRRAWRALRDQPALRVHAFRLGLKAIGACDGKIVFVSIERAAASNLNEARERALAELLPCLERTSAELGERCLLIFDEERSTDSTLTRAVHTHHRQQLLAGASPRVVEAPGIVHSHHTPGVQIADLAAFLLPRRRGGRDGPDSASGQAIAALWKVLEPSIARQIGP